MLLLLAFELPFEGFPLPLGPVLPLLGFRAEVRGVEVGPLEQAVQGLVGLGVPVAPGAVLAVPVVVLPGVHLAQDHVPVAVEEVVADPGGRGMVGGRGLQGRGRGRGLQGRGGRSGRVELI